MLTFQTPRELSAPQAVTAAIAKTTRACVNILRMCDCPLECELTAGDRFYHRTRGVLTPIRRRPQGVTFVHRMKTILVGIWLAGALTAAPIAKTDLYVGGEGGYHTYRIPALI